MNTTADARPRPDAESVRSRTTCYLAAVIVPLFVVLALFVSGVHEPWADEAQAWLIALNCTVTSVAGGVFGYAIGFFLFDAVGAPLLEFYGLNDRFAQFSEDYNEWGAWIVFIAGLTPILLERSLQAQFLIPMAISLAFGVLFATLITLLLVPASYAIQEDVKTFFRRLFAREAVSAEPAEAKEPLAGGEELLPTSE